MGTPEDGSSRNSIGLFWCWGVRYGLAEKNRIEGNRDYGISIGHHDTDNLIRDNDVRGSGKVGILFRDESRGKDFWPNRNRVESNRVTDSGGEDGVAIDVRGKTHDLRITDNLMGSGYEMRYVEISPVGQENNLKISRAVSGGGTPWRELMQDGPMYGHSFADPDGHVWEVLHMDLSQLG